MAKIGAANVSEIHIDANYVKLVALFFTTQFRFSLDLVTAGKNYKTFTVITSFTRGYVVITGLRLFCRSAERTCF